MSPRRRTRAQAISDAGDIFVACVGILLVCLGLLGFVGSLIAFIWTGSHLAVQIASTCFVLLAFIYVANRP